MKPATDISELSGAAMAASAAAGIDHDAVPSRARDFYELTKPRMNMLDVCTTAVGFAMAPPAGGVAGHWVVLLQAIVGTALTAAAASVLTQYAEREYDALMPRTRNRPLVKSRISPREALWMGVVLG